MEYIFLLIKLLIALSSAFIQTNTTPSNKIIQSINDSDIDQDGEIAKIILFYNTTQKDVELKIMNSEVSVIKVEDEKQIFNPEPSNKYTFQMMTKGNKILVGSTYSYTNKYGSTSKVNCYQYEDGKISKIWSSDDDDEKTFLDFVKSSKDNGQSKLEITLIITPEFSFYDYNHDGDQELITKSIISIEGSSISSVYYSIYEFSNEGVNQIEGWFSGNNPSLEKEIPFN
ncbi:hypothetical protein [Cohnella mopanensis]|uniref:hypothetical protein n=1 Tax=Cohnella mopanensis TaxID=2911966 RepID=UPI001EF9A6E4|nr:hypothetical protein [Cohnella mopanensis]